MKGKFPLHAVLIVVTIALVAACQQASPPAATKYVLTIQSDGTAATNPSGAVSVDAGVPTTVRITAATSGHIWTGSGAWTVVSGTALIADPNAISTTVTLNSGDATIQASIP